MGRPGNGSLRALAVRVDERFRTMEGRLTAVERTVSTLQKDVRALQKDVGALRKDTKLFMGHVVMLDDEFRSHRRDKTAHFVPAR